MTIKNFNNPDNENLDFLWTVEEVAHFLQIKPETVRALTRRGELPAIKIGKVWRYNPRRIRSCDFPLGNDKSFEGRKS